MLVYQRVIIDNNKHCFFHGGSHRSRKNPRKDPTGIRQALGPQATCVLVRKRRCGNLTGKALVFFNLCIHILEEIVRKAVCYIDLYCFLVGKIHVSLSVFLFNPLTDGTYLDVHPSS